MSEKPHPFWPAGRPHRLDPPERHLFENLAASAARTPDKPALVFYDTAISYLRLKREAERLAGFLRQGAGLGRGDRVLLFLQNAPQFIIAFQAILRADAIVVPVNVMNKTAELKHYVADSGARVAIVGQELLPEMAPLLGEGLEAIVVATYSDYLEVSTDLPVPDFVRAPRSWKPGKGLVAWTDAVATGGDPGPIRGGPDDLAVMPYTSGTTGFPKGCMHTHRTVMFTAVAGEVWGEGRADQVRLCCLPLFHVTAMQSGMNGALYTGATIVIQPRWDRDAAARFIARYKVAATAMISTQVVDFLANPRLGDHDISSLERLSGGGAAMPDAVAKKLTDLTGISYIEGYGLTETIAPTHINPPDRPKRQCLGIPIFGTEAMAIDPVGLAPVMPGETGEIVVRGPQIFRGYWRDEEKTKAAFIEIGGKSWFRTGDLGRVDEDGYYFIVDRLKRMINASGFKVWPAEVETLLYGHPAIQEACVISAPDAHRGETVKAVIVLREAARGTVSEAEIVAWGREKMAAFKAPRLVQFVEAIPRTPTAKVDWRRLQEAEWGTS